ncbi:hypothetical protein [Cecembia sp.]|uniref:hypothetical protein n=1 Tax=Cecembia sp. TaxID=1898110 RepID=UPI0025B90CD0|nr:hypothetical protein [Cecembia sp.]
MKNFFAHITLIVLIFSCVQSKHEEVLSRAYDNGIVTLEKIDSVQIEYLGNPIVHDIDPQSGTILFMEHGDTFEDIYVADFDGNILYTYPKFGDLPDTYGVLFGPLKIIGEKEFMAYGINGLLTYDLSGKLISRTKIQDIVPYNFARKSMGYGLGILDDAVLYIDQGSRNLDYSDLDIYHKVSPMITIDKITGKIEEVMKIPESSIYLNGKHFFRDAWAPVFGLTNDKLFVVFGAEPKIFVFDNNNSFSLIKEIPFTIPNYNYFLGESSFNPNSLMYYFSYGRVETINWLDGVFILGYFPGYNQIDINESLENKSLEGYREFGDRMRKKYPHRFAIFDSAGNLLNDFVLENVDPRNIILRNGELWAMEKPDWEIEKDYFTVYRLELKID